MAVWPERVRDRRGGCRRGAVMAMVTACALVSGCSEPPAATAEPARAVKVHTVAADPAAGGRRLAGTVRAIDSTALAFRVGGQVTELPVRQGDAVRRGQVLAQLDPVPFTLRLQSAQAELRQAEAALAEKTAKYHAHRALLDKGFTSRITFAGIEADYNAARNAVAMRQANLALAARDRDYAVLTAPFDGRIAERRVDPYVQVAAGQAVFQLDADGDREVAALVPESLIAGLAPDQPVRVAVAGADLPGRVREIGSRAESGNAFPVTVRIDAAAAAGQPLRSGLTAELILPGPAVAGVLVPYRAVLAGARQGEGEVYVLDSAGGRVQRRPVTTAGLHGDMIEIAQGLAAGERVAAAGVAFLADGQPVTVYPDQR